MNQNLQSSPKHEISVVDSRPPWRTLIAVAVCHGVMLSVLSMLVNWRSYQEVNAVLALIIITLLVLPGAAFGWWIRRRSLNLSRWLSYASTEWFIAGSSAWLLYQCRNFMTTISLYIMIFVIISFFVVFAAIDPNEEGSGGRIFRRGARIRTSVPQSSIGDMDRSKSI